MKGSSKSEADDNMYDKVGITPEWATGALMIITTGRLAGASSDSMTSHNQTVTNCSLQSTLLYPGNMVKYPPRQIWKSRLSIPPVYLALQLNEYMVMQRQKLDPLYTTKLVLGGIHQKVNQRQRACRCVLLCHIVAEQPRSGKSICMSR